jgi:glycerophosphoryl diester phosphodiesterase
VALRLGCDWVIWDYSLLDQAQITQAKLMGLKTSVFTVNDIDAMERCRQLGVDSMITDYPTRALQHFNKPS